MAEKMVAWFVCRAKGLVGDVMLPLKPGPIPGDDVLLKQGRMRAARVFKRERELHPCVKVDVELQAVGPAAKLV